MELLIKHNAFNLRHLHDFLRSRYSVEHLDAAVDDAHVAAGGIVVLDDLIGTWIDGGGQVEIADLGGGGELSAAGAGGRLALTGTPRLFVLAR